MHVHLCSLSMASLRKRERTPSKHLKAGHHWPAGTPMVTRHCMMTGVIIWLTVKPVLSGHSKRRRKIGFQDRLSLNAGQKYCRMLLESILQYFRPSFSYHLSLRPLFWLFLSGRLWQVLLYCVFDFYVSKRSVLSDYFGSIWFSSRMPNYHFLHGWRHFVENCNYIRTKIYVAQEKLRTHFF